MPRGFAVAAVSRLSTTTFASSPVRVTEVRPPSVEYVQTSRELTRPANNGPGAVPVGGLCRATVGEQPTTDAPGARTDAPPPPAAADCGAAAAYSLERSA